MNLLPSPDGVKNALRISAASGWSEGSTNSRKKDLRRLRSRAWTHSKDTSSSDLGRYLSDPVTGFQVRVPVLG